MATVFHNPVSFTRCLYVNYTNETLKNLSWCRLQESNPQPTDYKSVALPVVLSRHMVGMTGFEPVLPCSQNKCFAKLSYIPKYWLGYLDSNQGNARFRVWCLTTWLHPNNGGLRRARTFDLTVNSRLLSPLSYESMKRNLHFAYCVQLCLL